MVYITITINIKVLNSESIVIIRIKGEHLLHSKISGGMIGYIWMGECLLYSKFPSRGNIYYSKVSVGKVYYIVNIPWEGLICGRFTIRHRYQCCLCIRLVFGRLVGCF